MSANAAQRARWNDGRYVERLAKREQLTGAVTPVLMDALALLPGERLLDIGCGLGTATLRAAHTVGLDGAVTGVDISTPIIDRAAATAARSNVAHVLFQVADAQTDSFGGGPFTAAMSQFGVMFFDDPVAAFTNIRQHLTATGRLCFTCWQVADRNPWSFTAALADLVPRPSLPASATSCPGPFSLADTGRVRRLLHEAGFCQVEVTPHCTTADVAEDAVVDDVELALMGVRPDRIPQARALISRLLAPYRHRCGVLRLPLAFLAIKAR